MTPEEIAGCFLDYKDYFNEKKRNVAITGLNRLLENPSDGRAMSIITVSSSPDYGVMHEGYHKAAEAYQKASTETQQKIKQLMENPEKKSELLKKANPFLTPDADRVENQAKKQEEAQYFENLRAKAREELKGQKATSPSTTPSTSPQTSATSVGPQEQSPKQESPKTSNQPSTFKTMFEHKTFKGSYEKLSKDLDKLTYAQKAHVHNHLREEQIQLLDLIEKTLLSDPNPKANDADHAAIFYGVLTLMQKNLKHEFRWTELLGFPRKSRLESVVQDNIEQLSKNFPDVPMIDNKQQLKALLNNKGMQHLEKQVDKLLEPHGFLNAAKKFIEHGLDAFIPHKPKKP